MISCFQNETNSPVQDVLDPRAQLDELLLTIASSTKNFGYTVFPDIFEAICGELMDKMLAAIDADHPRIVIAAPRGFGKTSWILYGKCVRELVFRLTKFIVFITNTSTNAQVQTDNLKRVLTFNENIRELFGDLHPDSTQLEGNMDSFAKSGWTISNGGFVLPRGAGQQVRGLSVLINGKVVRPELVICDDIENAENVQSIEQRDKLRRWLYGDLLNTEGRYSKDPMRIVYIDTVKHDDALLSRLLKDPSWKALRLEACNDMLESFAPEYMSTETLRAKFAEYERMGMIDVFHQEFRNISVSNKDRPFKDTDFRYFYETPDGYLVTINAALSKQLRTGLIQKTVSPKELDDIKEVTYRISTSRREKGVTKGVYVESTTITILDPAKTQNLTSADSAFITFTVTTLGLFFVRNITVGKFTPNELYTHAIHICRTYNSNYFAVEITGIETFISQPMKDALMRGGLANLAHTMIELRANKYDKDERVIGWLSGYYAQHRIYHNVENFLGFESQLLSYPSGAKKDIPDAASWIIYITDELAFTFTNDQTNDYPSLDEDKIDFTGCEPFPTEIE